MTPPDGDATQVSFQDLQEELEVVFHIALEHNLPHLTHHANIHGPGVEIDATEIVGVDLCVSHKALLWWKGY